VPNGLGQRPWLHSLSPLFQGKIIVQDWPKLRLVYFEVFRANLLLWACWVGQYFWFSFGEYEWRNSVLPNHLSVVEHIAPDFRWRVSITQCPRWFHQRMRTKGNKNGLRCQPFIVTINFEWGPRLGQIVCL
jgi:hypothetical protein